MAKVEIEQEELNEYGRYKLGYHHLEQIQIMQEKTIKELIQEIKKINEDHLTFYLKTFLESGAYQQ